MKFENGIIKDSKSIEQNLVLNEFQKPLNEMEVLNSYKNPTEKSPRILEFYSKDLSKDINFNIYGWYYPEGKMTAGVLNFMIEDKSKPSKQVVSWIEIGGNDIRHRDIDSQYLGITGDVFLQKVLEYVKILKKNKLYDQDKIIAEVSQPSVLLWLKKNGFNLSKDNKDMPDDYFTYAGDKKVILNENKCFMIQFNDGRFKDKYLVDARVMNDKNNKYFKLLKAVENNGTTEYTIDNPHPLLHDIVEDMREDGMIPIFKQEYKL